MPTGGLVSSGACGDVGGGENVGSGAGVFKDEVDGVLRFRSLVSGDDTVTIVEGSDEIDLSVNQNANGAFRRDFLLMGG